MSQKKDFDLDSKIVGALPIVNHFLERMRVSTILGKHLSRPGLGPFQGTAFFSV